MEVEEVWDRTGRTRYGYVEPHDRFECEPTSEFKDWASDAPDACSAAVVDAWKVGAPSGADVVAVTGFVQNELGTWGAVPKRGWG